jgi:hypothetical protein
MSIGNNSENSKTLTIQNLTIYKNLNGLEKITRLNQ